MCMAKVSIKTWSESDASRADIGRLSPGNYYKATSDRKRLLITHIVLDGVHKNTHRIQSSSSFFEFVGNHLWTSPCTTRKCTPNAILLFCHFKINSKNCKNLLIGYFQPKTISYSSQSTVLCLEGKLLFSISHPILNQKVTSEKFIMKKRIALTIEAYFQELMTSVILNYRYIFIAIIIENLS